ncbi:hypothetical protein HMPREF9370_1992 [Neisseria wadsworthii 9715]|uniref:Uncharacterized protein n=1 Tax=Neisseria wadsworthii 9715 TaxID=1030841 RepID=G4CSD2_9NEIS|nr:hypothetical protein HMPREF9370_1992 [Neisseria wadsworthii 9715]
MFEGSVVFWLSVCHACLKGFQTGMVRIGCVFLLQYRTRII